MCVNIDGCSYVPLIMKLIEPKEMLIWRLAQALSAFGSMAPALVLFSSVSLTRRLVRSTSF